MVMTPLPITPMWGWSVLRMCVLLKKLKNKKWKASRVPSPTVEEAVGYLIFHGQFGSTALQFVLIEGQALLRPVNKLENEEVSQPRCSP
jgi:hypothetical protein